MESNHKVLIPKVIEAITANQGEMLETASVWYTGVSSISMPLPTVMAAIAQLAKTIAAVRNVDFPRDRRHPAHTRLVTPMPSNSADPVRIG